MDSALRTRLSPQPRRTPRPGSAEPPRAPPYVAAHHRKGRPARRPAQGSARLRLRTGYWPSRPGQGDGVHTSTAGGTEAAGLAECGVGRHELPGPVGEW